MQSHVPDYLTVWIVRVVLVERELGHFFDLLGC